MSILVGFRHKKTDLCQINRVETKFRLNYMIKVQTLDFKANTVCIILYFRIIFERQQPRFRGIYFGKKGSVILRVHRTAKKRVCCSLVCTVRQMCEQRTVRTKNSANNDQCGQRTVRTIHFQKSSNRANSANTVRWSLIIL